MNTSVFFFFLRGCFYFLNFVPGPQYFLVYNKISWGHDPYLSMKCVFHIYSIHAARRWFYAVFSVGSGFDELSVRSNVGLSLRHQVGRAQCISSSGTFSVLHFLFADAQPIVLIWRSVSHFLVTLSGP